MSGTFVKINGKWHRKNSDNTYTVVYPYDRNRFTWVQPDGTQVVSANRYNITKKPMNKYLSKLIAAFIPGSGFGRKIASYLLQRTGGTNSISGASASILSNAIPGVSTRYYDGRVHTPQQYTDQKYNDRHGTTELETTVAHDNKNYVKSASENTYNGFTLSPTRGRYSYMPKYSNSVAVNDTFYGDTIYAPKEAEKKYINNLGKSFRLSTDSTLQGAQYKYIDNTYDARNHYITFTKGKAGEYTPFLEDVFNTNNKVVDNYLMPIIVNQNPVLQFTDDPEKLNRIPWLSNWFLNPRNVESNTQDTD